MSSMIFLQMDFFFGVVVSLLEGREGEGGEQIIGFSSYFDIRRERRVYLVFVVSIIHRF